MKKITLFVLVFWGCILNSSAQTLQQCTTDNNNDGVTNTSDFLNLVGQFGQNCEPLGTISLFTCLDITNNGTLFQGNEAIDVSSIISYTGGNGGYHFGQIVNSTGVEGLYAALVEGSFASGEGSLTYRIFGTPTSSGTASFAINIGGQNCTLTRTVELPVGSITALSCSTTTNNGTLTQGVAAASISSSVPYTGGNGGTFTAQTVPSTGVAGLTATTEAGTFANGTGSLIYTITGTPATSGTATFELSIGGQTCTLTLTVIIAFTPGVLTSGNQALCNPANPANITFSTAASTGSSYQWYFQNGIIAAPVATAALTGWTSISGATASTYDAPSGLAANRTYACRVTNGTNSQWASGVRQITVLPVVNFGTLASGNQSFTGSGDPANIAFSTEPTGGAGAYSFQWYSSAGIQSAPTGTEIPSGWIAISGATSNNYDPPVQSESISYAVQVNPIDTPDCANANWALGVRHIIVNLPGLSTNYTSFNSTSLSRKAYVGDKIALLSSQFENSTTIPQLLDVLDSTYNFYKYCTGREPSPASLFQGKLTIADVPATCGAGCGYLGSTGIELQNSFFRILLDSVTIKNKYDQVVFYEFGRNFWFYGNKIEYKGSDNTGSIATGFAVFMRFAAMDAAGVEGAYFNGIPFALFRSEVVNLLGYYLANPNLNWSNTLRSGVGVPNAYNLGATDLFASFLFSLRDEFGDQFIHNVWKRVGERPNANTTQDAVDNFIISSCFASGSNLIEKFTNWRWPISVNALNLINQQFPIIGNITGLTCASATTNGTLTQAVAASSVSTSVPYAGGNGGTYTGQMVSSTGIIGLTANLSAGFFANGAGSLTYTITGTPASSGTASFAINIGGQSCILNLNVAPPVSQHSCGAANVHNPQKTYGTLIDQQNNVYKTIVIGTQIWMAEDLRTTIYRNGDLITNVTGNTQWSGLSTGAWCNYNNNIAYECPYGKMYNWYTVSDSRNLCPTGWHVPTDAEWTTLITFLGGTSIAGGKMRSTGTQYWLSPNITANNESGFSGLPGGLRGQNGIFNEGGSRGYWWSSSSANASQAWSRSASRSFSDVLTIASLKGNGYAVRCLKD